jgi:tight adherence protein B
VKRKGGGLLALLALVVGLGALVAPSAGAQTGGSVQVRRVISTDAAKVQVVFQYDGAATDVGGLKVTENGKAVPDIKATTALEAGAPPAIVLVVDSSASTDKNATLSEARKALHTFVAAAPAGTLFAVVTAGGDASLLQRLTTDRAAVNHALDLITPGGDGALWEGVARAAALFETETAPVPMLLLVTDGNGGKGTTFDTARGAVTSVGASVYAVGVKDGELGDQPQSLAADSGGRYAEAAKSADLSVELPKLTSAINGQYAFTYATDTPSGVNDLTLDVGGANVRSSYVAGSDARGVHSLAYQTPVSSSGVKFFQNGFGKLLAVVLGLLAAGLAAFALISVVVKEDTGLSAVLQPYAEYRQSAVGDDDDDDAESGFAQTPFVQRAVELTGQFADRQGMLVKVEGALERANLPLRAAEAIFFYIAASLVATLLVAGVTRSFLSALIALAVLGLAAPATLNILASRRKRKFEALLPDTLQLLSGTLRAGYSMMQGVEAVSQEVTEPMGRELRRVVTEARLGRPLEEALDSVAERMASNDFAWATMAIRIQREVGGNLSELLMTVADTMTQRERLRRDVKTLTAEGRMSAYVLGCLPVGLGFAMYTLNPDYMRLLWEDGIGQALLAGGLLLMLGGFYWMSKIVKIDI